jgi:hypothetical protein
MKNKPMHLLLFKIFCIISFCFCISSCVKEEFDTETCSSDCTVIQGKITTSGGTKPATNIKLELIWTNIKYMGGGIKRTRAVTETDKNGLFDFRIDLKNDEIKEGSFYIHIDADKSKYLSFNDYTIDLPQLKRDSLIIINNYLLPRKSYIEWKVLNLDKINHSDYFDSCFGGQMGFEKKSFSGTVVLWSSGLPLDKKIAVVGDQPLYIANLKAMNGIYYQKNDTIFLKPGETKVYIVDFLEKYPLR